MNSENDMTVTERDRERARSQFRDEIGVPCSDSTSLNGLTFGGIVRIIAVALAGERERCAKVADEHKANAKELQRGVMVEGVKANIRDPRWDEIQNAVGMAAAIAAAIRAGETK